MRKTFWVIIIGAVVLCGVIFCLTAEINEYIVIKADGLYEKIADKLWPYPQILEEYEKAYASILAYNMEDAVEIISKNIYKQISLIPEGAKMTEGDYYAACSTREIQASRLMRHMVMETSKQAEKYVNNGDTKKAAAIYAMDVLLGIQTIHMKPYDAISFLTGYPMIKGSLRSLNYVLGLKKDGDENVRLVELEKRVVSYKDKIEQIREFQPGWTKTGGKQLTSFIDEWDRQVGTPLFNEIKPIFEKYKSSLQVHSK